MYPTYFVRDGDISVKIHSIITFSFCFIDAVPQVSNLQLFTRLYQEVAFTCFDRKCFFDVYVVPAERAFRSLHEDYSFSQSVVVLPGTRFYQYCNNLYLTARSICVPLRYIYIIGYALLFLCLTSKFYRKFVRTIASVF